MHPVFYYALNPPCTPMQVVLVYLPLYPIWQTAVCTDSAHMEDTPGSIWMETWRSHLTLLPVRRGMVFHRVMLVEMTIHVQCKDKHVQVNMSWWWSKCKDTGFFDCLSKCYNYNLIGYQNRMQVCESVKMKMLIYITWTRYKFLPIHWNWHSYKFILTATLW